MNRRPIQVIGRTAYVPLTHGFQAIIDAEDVQAIKHYNWHARTEYKVVYACANAKPVNGRWAGRLRMHRVILAARKHEIVDHLNCNGLDNRKDNLRIVNRNQNQHNRRKMLQGTSKYKGVTWNKSSRKWQAQISVNGKSVYLGLFESEMAAYSAYCAASVKYHGPYGRTV